MSDSPQAAVPEYVTFLITTSNPEYNSTERRFSKSVTIRDLKRKLELVIGASAESMTLELYDQEDTFVSKLDNDVALLGSYPVHNGMKLHVVDDFALRKNLEPSPESEKYEMTLEEYEKRPNSIKSFLKKNKLGKYSEVEKAARQKAPTQEIKDDEELAKKCNVGDRCEVRLPEEPARRGTIKYIGQMANAEGWWVGVQYDEPLGEYNGNIDGKTYFECPDNHGGMVKPIYVKTGDFPETPSTVDEL